MRYSPVLTPVRAETLVLLARTATPDRQRPFRDCAASPAGSDTSFRAGDAARMTAKKLTLANIAASINVNLTSCRSSRSFSMAAKPRRAWPLARCGRVTVRRGRRWRVFPVIQGQSNHFHLFKIV